MNLICVPDNDESKGSCNLVFVDGEKDEDDDESISSPQKSFTLDGVSYKTYQELVNAKRQRNQKALEESGLLSLKQVATKRPWIKKSAPSTRRKSSRLSRDDTAGQESRSTSDKENLKPILVNDIKASISNDNAEEPKTFYKQRINNGSNLTIQQIVQECGSDWLHKNSVRHAELFIRELSQCVRGPPKIVHSAENTMQGQRKGKPSKPQGEAGSPSNSSKVNPPPPNDPNLAHPQLCPPSQSKPSSNPMWSQPYAHPPSTYFAQSSYPMWYNPQMHPSSSDYFVPSSYATWHHPHTYPISTHFDQSAYPMWNQPQVHPCSVDNMQSSYPMWCHPNVQMTPPEYGPPPYPAWSQPPSAHLVPPSSYPMLSQSHIRPTSAHGLKSPSPTLSRPDVNPKSIRTNIQPTTNDVVSSSSSPIENIQEEVDTQMTRPYAHPTLTDIEPPSTPSQSYPGTNLSSTQPHPHPKPADLIPSSSSPTVRRLEGNRSIADLNQLSTPATNLYNVNRSSADLVPSSSQSLSQPVVPTTSTPNGLGPPSSPVSIRSKVDAVVTHCFAKVCPKRICSVAIHPSKDRLIVTAGDTHGYVGILNVDHQHESSNSNKSENKSETSIDDDCSKNKYPNDIDDPIDNGMYLFRYHTGTIESLQWTESGSALISTSQDGTVRWFDVAKESVEQIFAFYDPSYRQYKNHQMTFGIDVGKLRMSHMQFGCLDHRTVNDKCMFLSTSIGTAMHLDLRMEGRVTFHEALSREKINTLSLHPNGYSLMSAGQDGDVLVWDVRKVGYNGMRKIKYTDRPEPCSKFVGSKPINSSFFSPSGQYAVSTTLENNIDIFTNMHLEHKPTYPATRIHHNNKTNNSETALMATYHSSLDIFCVGSAQKPRAIEIYDSTGEMLSSLSGDGISTIAGRCCFHPRTDRIVLAGGCRNGVVAVFR